MIHNPILPPYEGGMDEIRTDDCQCSHCTRFAFGPRYTNCCRWCPQHLGHTQKCNQRQAMLTWIMDAKVSQTPCGCCCCHRFACGPNHMTCCWNCSYGLPEHTYDCNHRQIMVQWFMEKAQSEPNPQSDPQPEAEPDPD